MIASALLTPDVLAHGIILGLVYGILAVGLVLVYRSSGVVNFAHGEIGALGAAVLAKLVLDEKWPFAVALPAVLVLGGAIGAATEIVVARRLARRPKLVLLVATIGLAQLLIVAQLLIPSIKEVAPYPSPLHHRLTIGSIILTGRDFLPLAAVPAIVIALVIWLARTPSGRALRAVGDNREAAELAGIHTGRIALLAWTIAGVVSTATAVLANPLQGVIVGQPSQSIGAGLLLRALAAALVGRLESLWLAIAGGIGVGVLQAIADTGRVAPAVADLGLLIFILLVVLVRWGGEGPVEEGALARVPPRRGALVRVGITARHAGYALIALAVVALPAWLARPSQLFSLSRLAVYALVGVSLVLLTGWAGQLSLGQFAFVGVGTFGAALLERHGVPFLVAVPIAAAAGAVVSLVVGVPALRVRGLELATTTLALAVACSSWLFTRSIFLSTAGVATVTRARVLRGPVVYYLFCVGALAAVAGIALSIRRSDLGRRLLAVRSNERRAAAVGVSPVATKLLAFALAGTLAALAGALLGGLRVHSSPGDFGPDESLRVVAITVIGGAGSLAGALVGAVVVLGVPAIFGDTTIAGLLPSGLGILVLALVFPGGLVEVGERLTRLWSRSTPSAEAPPQPAAAAPRPARSVVGLAVQDVTVRFGGRMALDRVSLDVAPGELLGLVGANGAGKSTLLDVINGFIIPDEGRVVVGGTDLSGRSPAARARAGIGRVMQDARLFDDLTLAEAVLLAVPGGDQRREATDALALMGLVPLADVPCQELSTGTRRLAELAIAVVRRPSVLLLDEPTAGLSQREADAFVPRLAAVRAELGSTTILVEHDVGLVVRVSDRIVCLGAGRVLAAGPAADVLRDPDVVASFLGAPLPVVQ